jgi:hypothetical protein
VKAGALKMSFGQNILHEVIDLGKTKVRVAVFEFPPAIND